MLRVVKIAPLLAAVVLALPSPAATVSVPLTGTNGQGALNMVDFDNESDEPSGPGDSFGYAYYFNTDRNLWSILPSAPTTADRAYYEGVLARAGIPYSNLTLSTVEVSPNAAAVNFGALEYDSALVTGSGTETLAPGQFTLLASSSDFTFPDGYPTFNGIKILVSDVQGAGVTFVNGAVASLDFTAKVTLSYDAFPTLLWEGALTFDGLEFAYDLDDEQELFGFGSLHYILDRSGAITSVPEPSTVLLLALGGLGLGWAVRRQHARR